MRIFAMAGLMAGTMGLMLAASPAMAVPTYSITPLGTLGGTTSYGMGINASGQVTRYSFTAGNGAIHAFLSSSGVMTDLGTLGGTNSVGFGINASGQVTGYSLIAGDAATHAFLYSGGTMYDLNALIAPTDPLYGVVTLNQARGINDSGQIVANGGGLAYLLTPISDVPEPAALALLGTALTGLLCARRRARPAPRGVPAH